MQMLILKAYAEEMLFQPLGKQTIPCVIAIVAGFGLRSIKALKGFFFYVPELKLELLIVETAGYPAMME